MAKPELGELVESRLAHRTIKRVGYGKRDFVVCGEKAHSDDMEDRERFIEAGHDYETVMDEGRARRDTRRISIEAESDESGKERE